MVRLNYKTLVVLLYIFGIILRIMLWWVNPPYNAFDNHFTPISLIMSSGAIPSRDACWQCYHPPVFYWVSAMIGNIAVNMGVNQPQLLKILQFMPCFYGILNVGVIYLILKKLSLSNFSRLIAFSAVCFLPRHIYMSAMNSNDTISYLFVSLSIYLLLIAFERKLSTLILLLTSIVISIALFTKYTSYVLLPVILIPFVFLFFKSSLVSRKKVAISLILILFLPIILLSLYFSSNFNNYDSPLPWNVEKLDPSLTQPRDNSPVDFFSFTPWEFINPPIIVPGKMHHFWTLVYSGMWFDTEPKFLYFMDSNQVWWNRYYAWIRGESDFPGNNNSISLLTKLTGAGLITLGLIPLLLFLFGFYNYFRGKWQIGAMTKYIDVLKMSLFPTLVLSNAAGIIALTWRLPVFCAMKPSYFLNSLPAFAVFLSLGVMPCENTKFLKWAIVIGFSCIYALVITHILHISLSII